MARPKFYPEKGKFLVCSRAALVRGRSLALEQPPSGEFGLATLPTLAHPNPSFPALGRQDITYLEVGRPMIPQLLLKCLLLLP